MMIYSVVLTSCVSDQVVLNHTGHVRTVRDAEYSEGLLCKQSVGAIISAAGNAENEGWPCSGDISGTSQGHCKKEKCFTNK